LNRGGEVRSKDDLRRENRLRAEAATAVHDFLSDLSDGQTFRAALDHVIALSTSLDEVRTAILRALLAAGAVALDQRNEHFEIWAKVIENEIAKTGDPSSRSDLLHLLRESVVLDTHNRPPRPR
jgi:hypothetical protein